jgi:hypothetical protein
MSQSQLGQRQAARGLPFIALPAGRGTPRDGGWGSVWAVVVLARGGSDQRDRGGRRGEEGAERK